MLQITVANDQQNEQFTHELGPIEFGRIEKEGVRRIVIRDRYVSRDQLQLLELPGGQLKLTNLGTAFTLADETEVEKGDMLTRPAPIELTLGYTTLTIVCEITGDDDSDLQTINRPVRPDIESESQNSLASLGESPSPAVLAHWFETLLTVQKSAIGSAAFYQETARAVVDLVGLDRGLVLLRDDADQWQVMESSIQGESAAASFSRSVLARVLAERRTWFQSPTGSTRAASLMQVESVVASPIFDRNEKIIGVVYGSRDVRSQSRKQGIQPLEAQVVQLLASAVSSGLARVDKETEAARMRVQFEQFSSPELVRELQQNPNLLEGNQRDISVLFSDIRGFSQMSQRLGPRRTYELVSDVMDSLTDQILLQNGVIIDYYGDGLAAMWNAPTDQSRHATLACQAALAMRKQLPSLNEKWGEVLESPLDVGIGIHSGPALVGNAGSRHRLKYGPRGHAVNLASRIESATKHVGLPILISTPTHSQLDLPFATRRVCSLYLVGIREPVEVHQLFGAEVDAAWTSLSTTYEQALGHFERQEFEAAEPLLQQLSEDNKDAVASLLFKRIQELRGEDEPFDLAIRMDTK